MNNASQHDIGSRRTRREFLRIGTLAGWGLTLPQLLRARSAATAAENLKSPRPAAEAVIHIFLPGGLPQQDSFDPKPLSSAEYRGDLGTVATCAPGERFSALFPQLARQSDKLAVVRSLSHPENDHDRGKLYMYSGARPSAAVQYPSIGSVVSQELGARRGLPPYVWYPLDPDRFPQSGFLSAAHNPFSLGNEPPSASFAVRDLAPAAEIDASHFARRRDLLERINRRFVAEHDSPRLDTVDQFYERAYSLVTSPEARRAFQLSAEPSAVQERYGRNEAGYGLLLARRLVESGVRFVSLNYPAASVGSAGSWDLHLDCHLLLKDLAAPLDQAFAALIGDLSDRGLLDSTLVILSTEFGRGPKINAAAGRDHWSKVFSIVMAGAGLRGGAIYGASDSTAAEPARDPVTVEDVAQTIYERLGIDSQRQIIAPGDRPLKLVDGGRPLRALFG